jgi:plastocyanin
VRRRWPALATLLAVLAFAAVAAAMDDSSGGPDVSILFGSVTPVNVDVVAGATVHWSNDSIRNHTITADDGSFDSGTVGPSGHFERMFDTTGTYAYHCRLHPYIRGTVEVFTLLLDRPTQPGAPGRSYPLSGRAALPAGTAIAIQSGSGDSWQHAADTTVNPDGTFTAPITPTTSTSYRAVAGSDQSPPVDLLVLNRKVGAGTRAVRGGSRVSATVTPASPGATVVLQLYLKERFGWWPAATQTLGKGSRASFTVHGRRRVSARVVLTLPDGATVIGTSPVLHVHGT